MNYFLLKLIPPRKTFPQDMTAAERDVMQAHIAYWKPIVEDGTALIVGPVGDPAGPWGMGVLRTSDQSAAQALADKDPAITSGVGMRAEVLPMLGVLVKQ